MNRLAAFATRHSRWAWTVAMLIVAAVGVLGGRAERDLLERDRFSLLNVEAQRRGVEVMSLTLNGNLMGSLSLLGLIDMGIKGDAGGADEPNTPGVLRVLESAGRSQGAYGVYVVGGDGVIKSSWGPGKSLTGVDVNFRPYAQAALAGKENIYAAIGTTSGERTLYFAAPVHEGMSADTPVIGAVVARVGMARLDKLLAQSDGMALLLSPQGLVFAGGETEWIGRLGVPLTPGLIGAIREARQFGTMFDDKAPEPLPVSTEPGIAEDGKGRYAAVRAPIDWGDPAGAWTLVLIEDLARTVPMAEVARAGLMAGAVALLIAMLLLSFLRNYHTQQETADRIRAYAEEQEARASLKARMAGVALRLQRADNVPALAQAFLAEAHELMGAMQGVMYTMDAGGKTLRFAGGYGCGGETPPTLAAGEGLLGQCVVERRLRVVEAPRADFWKIRSGLGETWPAAVLLAPIELNETVLGAVEVAVLTLPDQGSLERFREMLSLLSLNIEILRRGGRTEAEAGFCRVDETGGAGGGDPAGDQAPRGEAKA